MRILKRVTKWILGAFFVVAGANHFLRPAFYLSIMPPSLPWHLPLVYLSGFCEVAFGLLLLVPRCQAVAAWGLIALLIAVFPANLHMAMSPGLYSRFSPVGLWVRLPLQAVLIAWIYWYTRAHDEPARPIAPSEL